MLLAGAGCAAPHGHAPQVGRDQATQEGLDAVAQARADPSDPLHGHALRLASTRVAPHGHWIVRIEDRTAGGAICVDVGPLSARIADCSSPVVPPATRPTDTVTQPTA